MNTHSTIQAMVWLGLPQPPAWQLVLYFMCIGMFGKKLDFLLPERSAFF